MRKARIAMSYMVGQSVKRKREALVEAEREFMSAQKKSRVSRPVWYTDWVTGQRRKKMPKMSPAVMHVCSFLMMIMIVLIIRNSNSSSSYIS